MMVTFPKMPAVGNTERFLVSVGESKMDVYGVHQFCLRHGLGQSAPDVSWEFQ